MRPGSSRSKLCRRSPPRQIFALSFGCGSLKVWGEGSCKFNKNGTTTNNTKASQEPGLQRLSYHGMLCLISLQDRHLLTPRQESPHEHQQSLLLSRIITNVVRLDSLHLAVSPASPVLITSSHRRSSTSRLL